MNNALLDDSARNVLSAAIAGDDWLPHLDPIMTEMNALGGGPGRAIPPDLFAIPTTGLHEAFVAFKAEAPPVTSADIISLAPDRLERRSRAARRPTARRSAS